MIQSSVSISGELDRSSRELPDGSVIVTDAKGQVLSTTDVLGLRTDYSRDPFTGRLAVRVFGNWTKPDGAQVDSEGTLTYRDGDVEIKKQLNGLHVHKNRVTGVVIQTDHKNKQELVKQPHGEIWKRTTASDKELFEIWSNGKLGFRSETFNSPQSMEVVTPSGAKQLVDVIHAEHSWEDGVLVRNRFTFKSIDGKKTISLILAVGPTQICLTNVRAVTTNCMDGNPIETSYDLDANTKLRLDCDVRSREYANIVCVRNFVDGGNSAIAFRNAVGHEHIPFT